MNVTGIIVTSLRNVDAIVAHVQAVPSFFKG